MQSSNVEYGVAALLIVSVGVSILLANPRRRVNQAFFAMSAVSLAWFLLFWNLRSYGVTDHVPKLRWLFAIGALFPIAVWWSGECTIDPSAGKATWLRGLWLIIPMVGIAGLALSEHIFPSASSPSDKQIGAGYWVYLLATGAAWLSLAARWALAIRKLRGVRRSELQFLALGGTLVCFVGLVLTTLPSFGSSEGPRLIPYITLAFYGLTGWAIATRKVLGAKEVYFRLVVRAVLALIASLAVLAWYESVGGLVGDFFALLVALAVVTAVGVWWIGFEDKIERMFDRQIIERQKISEKLTTLSYEEFDPEQIIRKSEAVIGRWAGADVRIAYCESRTDLLTQLPGIEAFEALINSDQSFTTDGLKRVRSSSRDLAIIDSYEQNDVVAAAFSTALHHVPNLCIIFGRRQSEEPYRWREMVEARRWAESLENIVARARLTRQLLNTERVATAGLLAASIAHEIRNPLTAIKAGAELLPQCGNDSKFVEEFSDTLQGELARIEDLSAQLLTLSTPKKPKLEPLDLNGVVSYCAKLMQVRLRRHAIALSVAPCEPVCATADRAGLTQVLVNLVMNAQQAITGAEMQNGAIEIRVGCDGPWAFVDVIDNGPGVPVEHRTKIFDAFNTSKVGGFGLGLAVSVQNMRGMNGRLELVRSERGAHFRAQLPICAPASTAA